jgi:hypothetical protein
MESAMTQSSKFGAPVARHRRVVTLLSAVLLLCGYGSAATTPVILAPLPQLQFFDQSGRPLAFGCVFTYVNNSTSPLATYTDWTGGTLNKNPVILSAGGSANIWLQAGQAYSFRIASYGGTNCASGSTLYTVNGIGGGSSTLTTVVPYSSTPLFVDAAQNQLFQITLTGNASSQPLTAVGIVPPGLITWEITQDGSGGHTFSWPSNTIGGCTIGPNANQLTIQQFTWDGVQGVANGPCITGNGPIVSVGSIFDYGLTASAPLCTDSNKQIISGSGCNTSNAITVNGQVIPPGGSGNVNVGAATHSVALNEGNGNAMTGLTLGAGTFPLGVASADPTAASISTCTAGQASSFNGTSFTCFTPSSVQASSITILGSNIGLSTSPTTIQTKTVTMPSTGCPCRALVSYSQNLTTSNALQVAIYINDGTNNFATGQTLTTGAASNFTVTASSMSTGTYANSAVITFTETGATSSSTATAIQGNGAAVGQNSWLNVAIFTSN